MMSLGIYGVVFAGYSSNNNYSMLGGLRASAQMFSYEITFGATLIGMLMIYGTLDITQLVYSQQGLAGGFYPKWGIFLQPLGFILFCAAGSCRDQARIRSICPEGESEIVGYFIEYSGLKWGVFMLVDFLETILIACLVTLLFLGGWHVPFLQADGFHFGSNVIALSPLWVTTIQILAFFASFFLHLVFHVDPLVAAAVPLRSIDAAGLEHDASAFLIEYFCDRRYSAGLGQFSWLKQNSK